MHFRVREKGKVFFFWSKTYLDGKLIISGDETRKAFAETRISKSFGFKVKIMAAFLAEHF